MSSRSSESESKVASADRMAALELGGRVERISSAVREALERPRVSEEGEIARRSKASLSKTLCRLGIDWVCSDKGDWRREV